MVAKAVVYPETGLIPVRVLNSRGEMVCLPKGLELANMQLVDDDSVVAISPILENNATAQISEEEKEILWSLVSEVGDNISPDEKNQLFALLLE